MDLYILAEDLKPSKYFLQDTFLSKKDQNKPDEASEHQTIDFQVVFLDKKDLYRLVEAQETSKHIKDGFQVDFLGKKDLYRPGGV